MLVWRSVWAGLVARPVLLAALGVMLCGVAPTVGLRALGIENGFWFIAAWWTGPNGGDSWIPIRDALAYMTTGDPAGLYQATYYETEAQFIYPPLSLVFFRLTALLPGIDWTSLVAMNRASWWLTLASMAATMALLGIALHKFGGDRHAPDPLQWLMLGGISAVGTVAFFPFNSGYHNGNIQTWLNLLIILALLARIGGWRFAGGVLIGLVCIIKPQLSLVAVWALVRRDYAMVCGIAVVVAVFGGASLALYGLPVHLEYVALTGFLSRRGESYFGSHSVNGLLNRMLFIGNNVTFDGWHRLVHYDPRVYAGTMAAAAALILPTLWPRRAAGPMAASLDFCIALVAFTLASPIAYVPHFGFMLPVFWVATLAALRLPRHRFWPLAGIAMSYAVASTYWEVANRLAATHWNFLQSTMLFAALLLLAVLYWLRGRADATG